MLRIEEFTPVQKQLILIGMKECLKDHCTTVCWDCSSNRCDQCIETELKWEATYDTGTDEEFTQYEKQLNNCMCNRLEIGPENIKFLLDDWKDRDGDIWNFGPKWHDEPNKYDDIAVLTYNYTYGFTECKNGHPIPEWLATYGVNLERAHCYAS